MASKRFEIDMGLNASEVARGATDAKRSFTELEDALEDTGTGGARDLDKIEDKLKDVQRQSERTERAVDDIGDTGRAGLGKMSEGAQEVTQELGQNLGQAVSSVRGELSDLGQVGQDTLGGLSATLAGTGPAGIVGAAGLAAGAVGLGLITAELERQQEEAEQLRERLSAAFQEAAAAGRDYLDEAQLLSEANDLMWNTDRADEWKRLQEDANRLGVDRYTAIRANSGDLEAQALIQEHINALVEKETGLVGTRRGAIEETNFEVQQLRDRWQNVFEATAAYGENVEASRTITQQFFLDMIAGSQTVSEEVDDLGNRLLTLADGNQILIDADTGQATDDISKFRKDADDVIEEISSSEAVIRVRADMAQAARVRRDLQNWADRGLVVKVRPKVEGDWE